MKNKIFKYFPSLMIVVLLVSCQKELNKTPINTATADQAFSTALGYTQAMAKVYGAFALTGSTGSASSDLGGIDAGTSDFVRMYWYLQEFSTEEAVWVYNDPGVYDLHHMSWTASNIILTGLYNRCIYQITVANSFINQATDAKLSSRGITGTDATEIRYYRAEARFLRAYQYWVLMDLFGNPPFIDENTPIGKSFPKQIKRADLFTYIESELKAIDPLLAPAHHAYGRADQAADWALLARMYLNAEVYLGTGKGRYTDAITYASKVIGAGYSLKTNYADLFKSDNNVDNQEVILSINYDGTNTQNYGGTTTIINGALTSSQAIAFGVPGGGWSGYRTTQNLPLLFGDYSGNKDKRAMFAGSNLNMSDEYTFADGLQSVKWSNMASTGIAPPDKTVYCSTDFPIFRLAEIYLIYDEAVIRGGTGGSSSQALIYFNNLRKRAYANNDGVVAGISLKDILDERGRELYLEGARRTDLIRYNEFTTDTYLWPYKGGVKAGRAVEAYRNLYPLPATDVTANPNLIQNNGYN